MAFKPNYNMERAERDRRARAKKAAKQQAREERSAERKAEPEAETKPADSGPAES